MTKIILCIATLFIISACLLEMPHPSGFSYGHAGSAAVKHDDDSSSDSRS